MGDGDSNIVRFPPKYGAAGRKRACAVVDCYNARKTIAALKALKPEIISFICATHPHYDHNKGLAAVIEWCLKSGIPIEQFWDSGFRHVSKTHYDLIQLLERNPDIKFMYPTSGFEAVVNHVRVQVLSPSIMLKNRYDTFGTNINNASIVIKLEYPPKDTAPYYLSKKDISDEELDRDIKIDQHSVILAGDAQFDAWARVTQEFPELKETENRGQMIDTTVVKHRPLRCQVLKVPHHMSKHGFPHELTVMAVEDIRRKRKDNGIRYTGHPKKSLRSGTVVALFSEGRKNPLVYSLKEPVSKNSLL